MWCELCRIPACVCTANKIALFWSCVHGILEAMSFSIDWTPMRFVHTSDLHLGRKLAQMPLEQDCKHLLQQLKDLVEHSESQALVIAGDIYESQNPAEAAVRMWDRFITSMAEARIPVLAVSGNHDSGARLSVGSDLIALSGIHIAGELKGELKPVVVGDVNFWLIPFVRPTDVRSWATEQELDAGMVINYETAMKLVLDTARATEEFAARPNVCVAHQFVTNSGITPEQSDSEHLSLGTLDNVDYRVFDGFDYVALGHIHGPQRMGRDEVRYAGSPLKLSSSEIRQNKSFVVVDIAEEDDKTQVEFELVPVKPFRDFRKERGSVEELVARAKREDERMREDFIHAVVTDDDPVDVTARLRRVWPNLEQVEFDNAITRAAAEEQLPAEIDLEKNMIDLFHEFFRMQTGKSLADDEAKLVSDAFEKVLTEGGDVA